MNASLYVHIPFCERKCLYCDFYSVEGLARMPSFLEALEREIDLRREEGRGTLFGTVFFGGGTPSLLEPAELERILTRLRSRFAVAPDAEITVEANPGTLTRERCAAYRELGVNRLSIGVQSFDPDELRFLGRIHDPATAVRCVEDARGAGFDDVSLDLVYALPGQSREGWLRTLRRALALEPPHLSAYGLIVEDGTPLARLVEARQVSPVPAEQEAELFEATMAVMAAAGYEQYEVSNYARPGRRCRHNLTYWHHGTYLGFGPSAHSCRGRSVPEIRRRNIRSVAEYCRRLAEGEDPVVSEERLGAAELLTERVFLALRSDGLDLAGLTRDFGLRLGPGAATLFKALVQEGLATRREEVLRMTARGYLLCDEAAVRVLRALGAC